MENATKGLIIAAAVLIIILIVSLSMFLVNSSSESTNNSQSTMSELEINSFNYKFKKYEGTRKSSSQVVKLLKDVSYNNSTNSNKIAVKLTGSKLGSQSVYDSCSYIVLDDAGKVVRCNSGNVISLDEIISIVNSYKAYNYTVTFTYCNNKTQSSYNNKDLNPAAGCIFLIHISKN